MNQLRQGISGVRYTNILISNTSQKEKNLEKLLDLKRQKSYS